MNKKRFAHNMVYALIAQIVSLVLSVVISLVLPKILSVKNYGYWQLFIFYVNYIGFFHFGIIDGIYLKLGGLKYEELDFRLLNGELKILSLLQTISSFLICICSLIFIRDVNKRIVVFAFALYIPLTNLSYFIGYIFQAVNQSKIYSLSLILDKVLAIFIIPFLFIINKKHFIWYIIVYLFSKLLCMLYCFYMGRQILSVKTKITKSVLKDIQINMKVGMILLFSNLASMLVIGVGRLVINQVWGIETFGQISLAISLINFILQFISQISMILFPALKEIPPEEILDIFKLLQSLLGGFLLGALLLYIPIYLFVSFWLPAYAEGINYLCILMPVCFFDGKMNILSNTYLKILRKEKDLLFINLFSLLFCGIWVYTGGYIIKNMYCIIIGIIITVALRSIISEYIITYYLKIRLSIISFLEVFLVMFFTFCAFKKDIYWMFIYAFVYIAYILSNKERYILGIKKKE